MLFRENVVIDIWSPLRMSSRGLPRWLTSGRHSNLMLITFQPQGRLSLLICRKGIFAVEDRIPCGFLISVRQTELWRTDTLESWIDRYPVATYFTNNLTSYCWNFRWDYCHCSFTGRNVRIMPIDDEAQSLMDLSALSPQALGLKPLLLNLLRLSVWNFNPYFG